MHRIQFHYTLGDYSTPATVRNPLIDLLQAVSREGSISAAARALGLSYRHVWGELKRWEDRLGQELLHWEKGQAARLTEFAGKLLWAERQVQARLAPQIESLRSDLERAFAVAFDPQAHVVTLYASHDDALAALREHALQVEPGEPQLHLDIRFCGSVDAIRALNEGRCTMAGFHTLVRPERGSLIERSYQPLLQPGQHKIIGFAQRTQGLMVAPGNPLALHSLADIACKGVRFVARGHGSGTRLVQEELLAQAGLGAGALTPHASEESSHAAVAHAVASGAADAGLGLEAAARMQGLDFVPLVQEQYHLVCLKAALKEAPVVALCALLCSDAWQSELGSLPGYAPQHCGEVQSLHRVLPWWNVSGHRR